MKRLVCVVVAVCLAGCALAGCGVGASREEPANESVKETARNHPDASTTPEEATALVRSDLPEIGDPVGKIVINTADEDSDKVARIKGSAIQVYGVHAGKNATRLELAVTGSTNNVYPHERIFSFETAPVLKVDGKTYRPLAIKSFDGDPGRVIDALPRAVFSEARRSFMAYPALPDDVSEVEVASPLSDQSVKVRVDRGKEKAPQGTKDVPILARNVAYDVSNFEYDDSLITTIHAVTRMDGGVLLHYSLALPENAQPLKTVSNFSGEEAKGLFNMSMMDDFYLLDSQDNKYFEIPGGLTKSLGGWDFLSKFAENEFAYVGWAFFPNVDESTTSVDIELGDNQLVQDVPVSDEFPAGKELATSDFVKLGEGWPNPFNPDFEDSADYLELVEEKRQKASVVPNWVDLYSAVVDGDVTQTNVGVELDASVLFGSGESVVTVEGRAVIDEVAAEIEAAGVSSLSVVGHTDSNGSDSYNQGLSEDRAAAVVEVLRGLLPGVEITSSGKGEAEPIASNDTEQGRALNRRVEIRWKGVGAE